MGKKTIALIDSWSGILCGVGEGEPLEVARMVDGAAGCEGRDYEEHSPHTIVEDQRGYLAYEVPTGYVMTGDGLDIDAVERLRNASKLVARITWQGR